MTIACYIEAERPAKSRLQMAAVAAGCGGTIVEQAQPLAGASDHLIGGNWSAATRVISALRATGTAFWHLDAGWVPEHPKNGHHFRATRNGMAPQHLPGRSLERALSFGIKIERWRKNGRHVLVCPSSAVFGRPFGIDSAAWHSDVLERLAKLTDRPIRLRPKLPPSLRKPIAHDLNNAWCVVVHTSACGVDAALAGVPVFCEPSCGAAMVGSTDLSRIENPAMPDNREDWIAALAWQQFSFAEFRSGFAWREMQSWKRTPEP
jgi:hypothetical protein